MFALNDSVKGIDTISASTGKNIEQFKILIKQNLDSMGNISSNDNIER